jgi:hypothetical protein
MWLSARSWRSGSKADDIAELRRQKALPLPPFVPGAARECAELARLFFGPAIGAASITSVPCGHSQRADCAGAQLAQAVALELGAEYRPRFADRFLPGARHPAECKFLGPAILVDCNPAQLVIVVVDDVATSGWHLEDALGVLRAAGFRSLGIAWISGTVVGSESLAPDDDWTDILSLDL